MHCHARASAGEAAAVHLWSRASIPSSPEGNPCRAGNPSDRGAGTLFGHRFTLARKQYDTDLAVHCRAKHDAHTEAVTSFIPVHGEGKQDHIKMAVLCVQPVRG